MIGADESTGEFAALSVDHRPAVRVYRMTFDGDVWKIRRDPPGFKHRFEARLQDAGRKVAKWDKCVDEKTWVRDYDMVFDRVTRRRACSR